MATIAYKKFSGEIPNADPQLLPPERSQLAENCEFAGGSLKAVKDGFMLRTMANNPVKGIYTDDGINFYTWQQETQAFKSPTIDDAYSRLYFLTPAVGTLNVASTAGMAPNGPSPSANITWKAGVPRPTAAPVLTLVDRTTIPDHASAETKIEAWYEYAGKQYGKVTVSPTVNLALRKYTISKPTKPSDTPEGAVLAVKFSLSEPVNGVATEIAAATFKSGQPARSAAFPGGIEFSLDEPSATQAVITATWGNYETRAYTYTYRNTWYEEGAPAPAATISVTYIQDVAVAVSPGVFTGYRPFLDYKLYRTYGTGATYIGTDFTKAGDVLTDYARSSSVVGAALASTDWTPPPTGLQGLVLLPNGWFAAFKGNMLYMSEPNRPHAWPYSIAFSRAIRGLAVSQQSIVVTTADGVHAVSGGFPGSAQPIRLNQPQAGIAQRSMVAVDGAVAYASNDGIVFVSGAQASLEISQKLFTRIKWRERYAQALSDASLTFGYHDGCLVATSKSMNTGFTLRFDEGVGEFSRLSQGYDAMFYLPVADSLYYSIGPAVFQFKGGDGASFDWWGKDWIYPIPSTFGAGYLRSAGSVQLRVYADGNLVHSANIAPGYFRLPSLPRSLRWSIRLTGVSEVNEFYLAQTMGELKNV